MAKKKGYGLDADKVINEFVNKYRTEGDTWASNYKANIGSKYVENPQKQEEAKRLLREWYRELPNIAGAFSRAMAPARARQKQRRLQRVVAPAPTPA